MFENEQYVEATPLYSHILSLEPLVLEWNFRYGACLLYNSGDKSEGLRYLNAAVNDPKMDPRAHYFRGRALHLDYQFDAAKKEYQTYLNKRVKKDERYPVEREIQMCESGKKLLTTFTDIIVTNKQQIGEESFYQIYSDSKTIGGQIIRQYDFQSKIDKKKGHVPTVHFPPQAKMIFYSSYGDDDANGLDIYMRIRLPNGKWGEPQPVRGGVNSPQDEDFPFLHASGKYLYFSSKGHNSMGGYDVFMSRLDPNTNQFGPAENVDFAISSPDDDLFYVVDSAYQNAYFASARSSQDGMLHVYKVKVARVPLQEVIVMGSFTSEINPDDQKVSVKLIKHSNNQELETIPVTAARGGRYSYVFPQGGKYDYVVEVEGSGNTYTFTVELPFLDELRPLKQEIIHTKDEDGQEIVRIINKFDESVEGSEAIIAQVIRKKSQLEVNVDQFDLEQLESGQEREEMLAQLGFENMSINEVKDQLVELQDEVVNNEEVTDRILSNISSELVAKTDRVKELDQMEKELRDSSGKSNDPITKHKLLTEASQKQREKELLLEQINGLEELLGEVKEMSSGGADPEKIKDLTSKFDALVNEGKEDEAVKLLSDKQETLEEARSSSSSKIKEDIVKQTTDLRSKIRSLNEDKNSLEQSLNNVEARVKTLERERDGAKKKDLERIDSDIASAELEKKLTKDKIESLTAQIKDYEKQLNQTEEKLASLQNAMATEVKSDVTINEALDAGKEVEQIESDPVYNYTEELAELENNHPEINGGDPIADWNAQIDSENETEKARIENDPSMSELERTNRLIDNNTASIRAIDERLSYIDNQTNSSGNPRLEDQRKLLEEQKAELQESNKTLKEQEKALRENTPDAAMTKEDLLVEIAPNYESDLASIENDASLDERTRLEQIFDAQNQLGSTLDSQISAVEEQLKSNPEDEEARAKKELLSQLKSENESDILETQRQIGKLPVEIPEISSAEMVAQVDEGYQNRIDQINATVDSGVERERALLEENTQLLEKLAKEQESLDKKLKKDPENKTFKAEKKALEDAQSILSAEIAERNQTIAALENNSSVVESVTAQEILNEIAPDYQSTVQTIDEGNGTSLEKAEKKKELAESLKTDLEKTRKKLDKEVKKNPEDLEAQSRLNALDSAIASTEKSIELLDQEIASMDNTTPETSNVTAEEVIAELQDDYTSQLKEIESSDASPSEKARRKASVYAGLLEALGDEADRLEKEIKKSPEDEASQARKLAIDTAIEQQSRLLESATKDAAEFTTDEDKKEVISNVDSGYEQKIENAQSNEERAAAERDLQEKLREKIVEAEKQKERKFTVSVAVEKLTYEKLLEESKQREVAYSEPETVTDESTFIAAVRKDTNGAEEALMSEPTALNELKQQDAILEAYEKTLDGKIEQVGKEIEVNATAEKESELNWLLTEKERVSKKRRAFSVSIGELESDVVASTETDSELRQLENEEQEIRNKLESETLSNSEKNQLTKELAKVEERQYERKNTLIKEDLAAKENESADLINTVKNDVTANGGSDVSERLIAHSERENATIEELEDQAEEASSEAERNYLLNQAQQQRDKLNDNLRETVAEEKLESLREEFDINTSTESELERKKRRFIIEIGEISTEIAQVEEEMESAKRRDLPELEQRRANLIAEKELLEAKLQSVESQLVEKEENPQALNPKALDEEISFNEERKLAATEEYGLYRTAALEALKIDNEIRTLEEQLSEKRNSLQQSVLNGDDEETVRLKAREIQEIENKLDAKRIDLQQKKYTADQALPNDEEEAMKMQNLVARGIQPIKVAAVATALLQMPTTGFAIDTSASAPNNGATKIPVGVKSPEGLVYRVQVGAFARPLRSDVFSEFNPVSGEKIEGTNITRYMAGYFNSSETVVNAQKQIRGLGYSDAFIVAYCNGERITFGEARRLEEAGICVPKRAEEIMIEVAENTAENLNIPLTAGELKEVSELSYNQAPGAIPADPIENMEGLFFTVQIGVFNRPVTSEDLYNLPSISTFRLPNGQIRYNTGMFDSAEDALPRQNFARQSGINGAFIVAYYKGERISIGNARRLLNQYGSSILQSRKDIKPVEKIDVTRSDSLELDVIELAPLEEWEMRVQVVTEKTFDEFPRDVLNRYNAEGSFYYDTKDRKVKSVIYKNEEYLPNLWNFQDDIDTIYFDAGILEDQKTEVLGVAFSDSIIPGDFMDWILRCNYRRDMYRSRKGVEVRIFGVSEEEIDGIIEQIRMFGVEPERISETEDIEEDGN